MSSDDETLSVECDEHGSSVGAIVCCHMVKPDREVVGFIENSDDPDDLQAWCDACEQMYLQEGDKTERFVAFNDFAVVCTGCYAAIKKRHSR